MATGLNSLTYPAVLYPIQEEININAKSAEAGKITKKSFEILRKDISSHIAKLRRAESKRKLTGEEIEFLEKFEEELEDVEKVIDKEIGDITR